jgi:hypothetical protein
MRRFLRFACVGLALIGVVTAASAQAAGNTKPYSANVRVESAVTPNKFRLTLTNDPKAQQALGSANFTLPANFTAPDGVSAISNVSTSNPAVSFNISVLSNVVQFRAVSSSTALVAGATISADVTVTLPDSSGCTSAAWGVQAKQSNDFSGAPGNFMALNPASDLTPLGSFTFAPIGTTVSGVFVPQVLIGDRTFAIGVNALDTCGHLDQDYSGATAARTTSQVPTRLQNVTFTALNFSGGTGSGSANISQANVEAGDTITVTDDNGSGISGVSTSSGDPAHPNSPFDVVQTICTGAGTVCVWHNNNNSINANSTVPGDTNASLGFGFRSQNSISSTTCDGGSRALLGDVVDINPHNYGSSYQVTIVYSKSVTGNGAASSFRFCLSEDDTQSWTSLPTCSASITTKCIVSQGRVSGGALQFMLLLPPGDPWGGVG